MVLVFPAPLRPSTATTSPRQARKSTPFTATSSPYRTTRPDTSTAADSVADMNDRTYRDVIHANEAANTSGAACTGSLVGQSCTEPPARPLATRDQEAG